MLELEVVPGLGLCNEQIEFILGMHFSQAVATIQSMVGSVKGVQILYSDKDPLKVDLVITLALDGLRLIFDPINQRLRVIEVYDLSCLKLRYGDTAFNSLAESVSPTVEQIDQTFGATHPGVYDGERQVFTLTFRGLSFEFPAETRFQPSYGGTRQELGRLQFPPGESPRVSRMRIYSGNPIPGGSSESGLDDESLSGLQPSLPPAPPPPTPRYPCMFGEKIDVLRRGRSTLGIRVTAVSVPPASDVPGPRRKGLLGADHPGGDKLTAEGGGSVVVRDVHFGDSVEDVVSALGAPARIFYKSEDKMRIHSPNPYRRATAQRSDFFYNYFTLGLDLLFDARTNSVKKYILHTNYPGHYNFNMYQRCMFELPIQPCGGGPSSPSSCRRRGHHRPQQAQNQPQQYLGSLTPLTITPFTRWDEIAERVRPSERPVVLNRASSTNTTNPFGSTFCYGYQDIIFEVMPNSHIASLTLYNHSCISSASCSFDHLHASCRGSDDGDDDLLVYPQCYPQAQTQILPGTYSVVATTATLTGGGSFARRRISESAVSETGGTLPEFDDLSVT